MCAFKIRIFEGKNQKYTYCFFPQLCFNINIDPKEGLNLQLNSWGFFYLINIDGLVKSDAPRAPSLHKASHFIGQARQGFLGTCRQKYSDARHTNTK